MPSCHPTVERSKRLVVHLARVVDLLLPGDVATDLVATLAHQQRGDQAGHAAVAVLKRMDHEKVEHVCAEQQQGVVGALCAGLVEQPVQLPHVAGSVRGAHGVQADDLGPVGMPLDDPVLTDLEPAAAVIEEREQPAVKLQHHVQAKRNVLAVLVDLLQHASIAGHLRLRAALRRHLSQRQLAQTLLRDMDVLDRVGRLHALNHRYRLEALQHCGVLPAQGILVATPAVDLGQGVYEVGGQEAEMPVEVLEGPHEKTLSCAAEIIGLLGVTVGFLALRLSFFG